MVRRWSALVLLSLVCGCAAAPPPDWTERPVLGPPAGATDVIGCLVVAPDAPTTLYVAGNAGLPSLEPQRARPYLMVSEDSGVTWRSLQAGLGEVGVTSLAVGWSSGGTGRVLLAGSTEGLYRSKDAGVRWEHLVRGLPEEFRAQAVAIAPHDSDLMFAVADAGQVWYSHDGGQSWTRSEGVEGLPAALFASSSTRCLLQTDAGLFRSQDAGRTWQKLSTHGGVPGYAALSVCERAPEVIYAITKRDGVSQAVRSLDGGVTWEVLPGTEGAQDVEVDPELRDTVYLLQPRGPDQVLITRDAGLQWSAVGGAVHAVELVVARTRPRALYAFDRASRALRTIQVDPAPQ